MSASILKMAMLSLLTGSPVTTKVSWAPGPSEWAASDLIAPARGIPREDIKENPNCLLIVKPKGGRLGYLKNNRNHTAKHTWTDTIVMDFLENLPSQ
uniref:Uncharacterized protein n=1 Tax=Populus trichocarpa TaxID=3694 RepID=A0A2K2BUH0_POPTR